MKTLWTIVLLMIVLGLSSCGPSPIPSSSPATADAASSVDASLPLLKTTMGDFVIVSARLVDEVHGDNPLPGEKFLLVSLARPGLGKLVAGEFSLEGFQKMVTEGGDEIYISGNDGSRRYSTGMGGWIEDEFVMGFMVSITDTYTLYWPGNSPIDLDIDG